MKQALILLGAVALLLLIVCVDYVFVPLVLKSILGWVGIGLSFLQCLVITLFFNIVTYGFRKKG